jgi:hypothetical protein
MFTPRQVCEWSSADAWLNMPRASNAMSNFFMSLPRIVIFLFSTVVLGNCLIFGIDLQICV